MGFHYLTDKTVEDIFELDTQAVVVPHLVKEAKEKSYMNCDEINGGGFEYLKFKTVEKLPKVSEYILSKGDIKTILHQYEKSEWAYKLGEDYLSDNDCLPDNSVFPDSHRHPKVVKTSAYGLSGKAVKNFYHILLPKSLESYSLTENGEPTEYVREVSRGELFASLYYCYQRVLDCAFDDGIESIAFPLLAMDKQSGFPVNMPISAAEAAVGDWLKNHIRFFVPNDEYLEKYKRKYKYTIQLKKQDPAYDVRTDIIKSNISSPMEIYIVNPTWNLTEMGIDSPLLNKEEQEEFMARIKLKREITLSGKSEEKFTDDYIRSCIDDFIKETGKKLNVIRDKIHYDIYPFHKNPSKIQPHIETVLIMARYFGLTGYNRLKFIWLSGHSLYPSDYRDRDAERIAANPSLDFDSFMSEILNAYSKNKSKKVKKGKDKKLEK